MDRYFSSAVAILFGALPATILVRLAPFGEQFGAEPSGAIEDPVARVFAGLAVVLVFLAMFAHWAAALGQPPVDGATALWRIGALSARVGMSPVCTDTPLGIFGRDNTRPWSADIAAELTRIALGLMLVFGRSGLERGILWFKDFGLKGKQSSTQK